MIIINTLGGTPRSHQSLANSVRNPERMNLHLPQSYVNVLSLSRLNMHTVQAVGQCFKVCVMSTLRTPSVPSLERALRILEILADSHRGLTLSNLTGRTGLPKSSLHSLLLTLERTEYLHRNEVTGRYLFGTKLFSLATKSISRLELKEQALPFLLPLAQDSGLTVHLAIPERGTAILIEKIDPPGLVRLATSLVNRWTCTVRVWARLCWLICLKRRYRN
jgi:IclR helix-turn-helix domain